MLKLSGIFTLSMGILMISVWIVFLALDQFPEIKTIPLEAAFLLAAESLTATALIFGGISVLKKQKWGKKLNLTAMGMMLYTSIYSIGVFGQDGIFPLFVFFIILTICTIFFSTKLILAQDGMSV